jgi:hypothetical protein
MKRPNSSRVPFVTLRQLQSTGLLLLAVVVGSAVAHAATMTVVGQKVTSNAARDQPCYGDNCADRSELHITLPAGATYVGTHYFTSAGWPNDYADVREVGTADVSFSHFSVATYATNNVGQIVVTVYYYNRSTRNRLVSINVDYLP